jgi:hypothetical protein
MVGVNDRVERLPGPHPAPRRSGFPEVRPATAVALREIRRNLLPSVRARALLRSCLYMASTRAHATDWLGVIKAEYRESPGLRLTRPQVQRLWGLDDQACTAVLDTLIASRFLVKTARNAYMLAEGR